MQKFVTLFSGVGPFNKGDVVEEKSFDDEAVQRLVGMGAIRPATPDEMKARKVDVVEKADRHATYETRLADKDRQIANLKVKIAQMEAENQALRAAVQPKKPEPLMPSAGELLAEKERQIKALQAEVKNKK